MEQFLVPGAEDEVPLLRVQVAGDEVLGAESGEGGVELGGGGFMEGRDALRGSVYKRFGRCTSIDYLSSEQARWRMRGWRLSAALCGRRAAGAENNGCRASSWWRRCRIVSRCLHEWPMALVVRPHCHTRSLRCPSRSSAWQGTPAAKLRQQQRQQQQRRRRRRRRMVQPKRGTWSTAGRAHTSHTTPACRSLSSRCALWPASSKRSANVALSASSSSSSSTLAPTPPPQHRPCNTLRCRLATQHLPRPSAPVRPPSRIVLAPPSPSQDSPI